MRFSRRLALFSVLGLSLLPATLLPAMANDEDNSGTSAVSVTAHAFPALFGTREVYSADNSAFFKWTGMLGRFHAEQERATVPCSSAATERCEPTEWRRIVNDLRGLDLRARLDRVNAEINRYPYISSMRNWGESNHWETPFEFFSKSGQCQDYAIAKYLLLRAAGTPAEQLRLVVLRDMRLGLDHAVIVAYVDGVALLLDNQMPTVVPVETVHHYQPYYSINERGWWRHPGPNSRSAAIAGGAALN